MSVFTGLEFRFCNVLVVVPWTALYKFNQPISNTCCKEELKINLKQLSVFEHSDCNNVI